jgi:hypothetical protein
MTSDAGARSSNGLAVLWDVIVAPREAFATLRERPYVGWAFLATCILGMAGALLQIPAGEHVAVATLSSNATHDPRIAAMTPEQIQQTITISKTVQHWTWAFYPVIAALAFLVTAIVLLVLNAIGRGDGSFRKSLAIAANVGFLSFGINYFVIGVLAALRGGDAFNVTLDLISLMPSFAWLAPGAPVKLATFLAGFNIFSLWSFVLLALGMRVTMRVSPAVAWGGATLFLIGAAAIPSAFAR